MNQKKNKLKLFIKYFNFAKFKCNSRIKFLRWIYEKNDFF